MRGALSQALPSLVVKVKISRKGWHVDAINDLAREQGITVNALTERWLAAGLQELIEANVHAGEMSRFAYQEELEERAASNEPICFDVNSRF